MELVIDTNIVGSALLVKSDLLKIIFNPNIDLFSPEFFLEEIEKYKLEFKRRSKYSGEEFELLLSLITNKIRFIPKNEYEHLKAKALQISPDEKDWPFVALHIAMNCPLWTHDGKLLRSKQINTISSGELIAKMA